MKRIAFVASVSLAVLAGCGNGTPINGSSDMAGATPRPDGGNAPTCGPGIYPCGPYGVVIGQTIDNLKLLGQKDDNMNGTPTDDPVRPIQLSDYYQDPKVKVLAILVAAEWCVPCQMEQPELITSWKNYQAKNAGVAYLEAIIEDRNHAPADMTTVDRWANHMWGMPPQLIPFDMAADPNVVLGPYYNIAAFPMQMVITTKDMQIQWQNNGYSPGALETQIDSLLAN